MNETFTMLLRMIHIDIARATLVTFPPSVFSILYFYGTREPLAIILLDYCKPKNVDSGIEYANTLFGALFSVSALPKVASGSFEFFQEPLDQVVARNKVYQSQLHIFICRLVM